MNAPIHLIDLLDHATILVSGSGKVELQTMSCARNSGSAIFQHPPALLTFPAIRLSAASRLDLSCGIHDVVLDRILNPVRFTIRVEPTEGPAETVFDRTLDPATVPGDIGWHPASIALEKWDGQAVRLVLETQSIHGETRFAWAGWNDPVLHGAEAPVQQRHRARRGNPERILLLVVADALRQDMLGCYGNPRMATPHLDALAADGLLFEHARTPSTTTLAASVSLLTGATPSRHGLNMEWGNMPFHLPTLPSRLAAAGWHTALAASERELVSHRYGIGRFFQEVLPCAGNPAQDGAITTRSLLRWLEHELPDAPLFLWAQYFDTHPPDTPPEPFRSMYAPENPLLGQPDPRMQKIRGIESVADLRRFREKASRGEIDDFCVLRFRDTARALLGGFDTTPDLAEHVIAFGPAAWRGGSLDRLARELAREASELAAGRIPSTIVPWVDTILPMLEQAERQILSWLDGISDFQYPISQYQGAVSYFDHHIGNLVAGLRRLGLDERTTIVITSPHGESLEENEVYFHHHLPTECVLRVPMIVRPAAWSHLPKGKRIGGIMDLADLPSTLLDLTGVPTTGTTDAHGTSRAADWRGGESIAPHDSFSENVHGFMPTMVRWPWKLLLATHRHDCGGRWQWEAGESRLVDLRDPGDESTDHSAEHPEIASAMLETLTAWIATNQTSREDRAHPGTPGAAHDENPADSLAHSVEAPAFVLARVAKPWQRELRKVARIIDRAEAETARLYQSRRWRATNLLRSAEKSGYGPLDRVFADWNRWKENHPGLLDSKRDTTTSSHMLWLEDHRPSSQVLESMQVEGATQTYPHFHWIVPANSSAAASVEAQIWKSWSSHSDAAEFTPDDDDWIGVLRANDELEPHALAELARIYHQKPGSEILYTDHDLRADTACYRDPHFKPDWSPETLLAADYIGRAVVLRAGLIKALPDWRGRLSPDGLYDLLLEAAESARSIRRLAGIFFHLEPEKPAEKKMLERAAITRTLVRRGIPATVADSRGFGHRIRRAITLREKISIIIPTRNRIDLLKRCVESLVRYTDYEPYEIIIVDNGSDDPAALEWLAHCGHRVIRHDRPFNYAELNNVGVANCESPWILLLNNDTEIIHPDWLTEMASHLQDPAIGAVGAKLLFPDGRIQHAGVTLGICGLAAHTGLGQTNDISSQWNAIHTLRNVSAVTAACLLTRRDLWLAHGGMDQDRLAISFNDTDYCLRLRAAGQRIIYTPHAVLKHHESATRIRSDRPEEVAFFRQRVADLCPRDPYYNPLLDHGRASFRC